MTRFSRFAPAIVLLAVTLAIVPSLLPGSLLARSHSAPTLSAPTQTRVQTHPVIVVHLRPVALPMPVSPPPLAHTVVAGDTPWDVARMAGVDVAALLAVNHLVPGALLHPGQVLVLPPADTPGVGDVRRAAAPPQPVTHTVVPGDTLWDIAASAGVSVSALAAANQLVPRETLHLGRVLIVPAEGSAPTVRTATGPAAPRPGSAGSSGEPLSTAQQIQARRSQLSWPASGTITSRFGWRIHPIFRTREFHTGLDIATRWGSPVLAARSGVVRFVGWKSGYGQMIVLDHGDGLETTYSHLSSAVVSPGQTVAQGQLIGHIGNSGWSTGPHLFFEVRRDGVAVDPTGYLN
ncbi:MAG TPA: M23 family metallopeptidase [bacterium]|nr:M23 family metallopeptidase [bacterium]